mgnify:FL=1
MAKILIVATSDIHIKTFHVPFIEVLRKRGHKVEIAVENRSGLPFRKISREHNIVFPRKIFSRNHFSSLKKLRAIILEGKFDIVHCHTPIPSALTRLAVRPLKSKRPTTVYTAHGFHFYPGSNFAKFLLYFSVERFLSRWTDALICINRFDFFYSKRYFRAAETFLIPGVGVSSSRFAAQQPEARTEKRRRLSCEQDDFVLAYVAEFIPRKNHRFLIEAISKLQKSIESLKLLLVGTGPLQPEMKELCARLNLDGKVQFLGFREDVEDIVSVVDLGVSTSRHEGLGLGVAEHMLCGVPVVASLDRGHIELIDHGSNGFLYKQNKVTEFCRYIETLANDLDLRRKFGDAAQRKAKNFVTEFSLNAITAIYADILQDRW